jgi:hypothetical protein
MNIFLGIVEVWLLVLIWNKLDDLVKQVKEQ